MSERVPVKPKKGRVFVGEALKSLDRKENFAVLATRGSGGSPYASLISFACTGDLKEVIFATPRRSRKYRNLMSAKQVALLIDNRSTTDGDIMGTEAVTVMGTARLLRKGAARESREALFLKKHPGLKEFVRSPSTALVSVVVDECIHVSRFQAISVWRPDGGK